MTLFGIANTVPADKGPKSSSDTTHRVRVYLEFTSYDNETGDPRLGDAWLEVEPADADYVADVLDYEAEAVGWNTVLGLPTSSPELELWWMREGYCPDDAFECDVEVRYWTDYWGEHDSETEVSNVTAPPRDRDRLISSWTAHWWQVREDWDDPHPFETYHPHWSEP